jgi:uncharacterized protein (TIGR03083 family)
MIDELTALRASVARLRALVEPLDGAQLRASAYPSEWSIAEVLSHVGSGAVIMGLRIEAERSGHELADDFAPPIWDEWNAKSPEAQAADALVADAALVDQFASLTDAEREKLRFSMGPLQLDAQEFVGLRVNEHALHTWDVEVALQPTATLPTDATAVIIDNLGMIAGFTGKPADDERVISVRTTEPSRAFTLALGPSRVALTATEYDHPPDLELPAEAFVRLVYGRLDPAHTPPVHGPADLDELRRTFPGM